MTVQLSLKRNDWFFHTWPWFRPFLLVHLPFCGRLICDGDDLWSVSTANDAESFFTMSPRSTTRPLYFWNCGSNSEFLRWQRSINDAKWTFLPLFLASSITSFLLPTFVSCPAGIFSSLSHSLSTAAFAAGIFMAWGKWMNLCTRLWWLTEIIPFPALWSSYGNLIEIPPYALRSLQME